MIRLSRYLQKWNQAFQTFDTSLGIDICGEEVLFVRVRKGVRGFSIIDRISVPFDSNLLGKDLGDLILRTIEEHGLKADYINLNLPVRNMLVKEVSIPAMPESGIRAFLTQNPDLYLPAGLDNRDFRISYTHLPSPNGNLHLLLFIYRSDETVKWRVHESTKLNLLTFNFRGSFVDLWPKLIGSDYTGYVLDIEENDIFLISFENGRLTGIQKHEYGPTSSIKDYLNPILNDPSMNCIVACHRTGEYFPELDIWEVNQKFYLPEPRYLKAYATGCMPFLDSPPYPDIRADEEKPSAEQSYYKRLSKKFSLFSGLAIILLYLLSMGVSLILNHFYASRLEKADALKPLRQQNQLLIRKLSGLQTTEEKYGLLTRQKSFFAFYLYRIAENVPSEVWLYQSVIVNEDKDGCQIQLNGFAFSESNVTGFLDRLEKLPFCKNLLLDEMVVYDHKEVVQKIKLNYRRLVEFKVHFYV